jgi:hypothetical protein
LVGAKQVRLTKIERCGHGYKKGIQNQYFLGTELVLHNHMLYLTIICEISYLGIIVRCRAPFQVGN